MTDASPSITSFRSMVLTGMGSGMAGDKIGDALADILNWFVQLACHCNPPPVVTSAFHTVVLGAVMGLAFTAHYQIVKSKEN